MSHKSKLASSTQTNNASPYLRSSWRPLPTIRYGVAIANYTPPGDDSKTSRYSSNRYSWNGLGSQTISQPNHHAQELLIGDEVYAFEQCQKDDGHIWYRGYVCPPRKVAEKQAEAVVFLGIFPADCIYGRTEMQDSQNILSDAHLASLRLGEQTPRRMDALPEEEEEDGGDANETGAAFEHLLNGNGAHTPGKGVKQPPPLPILGMKDMSASPSKDPLLDEIAAVVGGWFARLPRYLESCRYKLFETVIGHIQSLLTARIQLMTEILSMAEEHALRREIVLVMTRGDIAQDLDVIVRDAFGRPVTSKMGNQTAATWMSGISLFAAQVDNWYSEESSVLKMSPSHPTRPASIISTEQSVSSKSFTTPTGQSLLIEIKTLVARVPAGETVELLLSVWRASSRSYITEECRFELDRGVSIDATDGRMRTRFQLDDLDDTCSLVIKSIRKGAMIVRPSDKSDVLARIIQDENPNNGDFPGSPALQDPDWFKVDKVQKSPLRRPMGVSVIGFGQLRRAGGQAEFSVPVWAPMEETAWASLPLEVLENRTHNYCQSPLIESIAFTSRAVDPSSFRGLHGAAETRFLSARLGRRQNDLYLKLWSLDLKGLIARGELSSKASIQIEIQTRSTSEGNGLEAIQVAPGKKTDSCVSVTLLGTSQPVLAELIKLDVNEGLSHLFFTITDIKDGQALDPKRQPIAFAYCPLVTGPYSVVADGELKLAVLPYDYALVSAATYTGRSHLADQGDFVTIKVQNASQKTSDAVILRLLDRNTSEDDPKDLLHLLTFCPPEERSKFRSQLVDIILGFLTKHETADDEVEDVSLRALMAVLEGPYHRQRTHPLELGMTSPKSAGAATPLLRSVRRVMASRDTSSCRRLIQHLGPIIQLVSASRDHIKKDSSEAVGAHLQSQIDSEVRSLLTKDVPALYGGGVGLAVRVLILQHYGSMIPTLSQIFNRSALVNILIVFIDAVGRDSDSKVRSATLSFLLQDIIKDNLLQDADLRDMILPSCVRVIAAGLQPSTNTPDIGLKAFKHERLAVSAAASLIHTLENTAILGPSVSKDLVLRLEDNIEYVVIRLLLPLLQLYKRCVSPIDGLIATSYQQTTTLRIPVVFPKGEAPDLITVGPLETPLVGEVAATILAMTQGCPFDRLTSFLSECREVQGPEHAVSLLIMAITFHQNVLQGQAFPTNWLSCVELGVASALTWLAVFIETFKTPGFWVDNAATALWVQCFELLGDVLRIIGKTESNMGAGYEMDGVRGLSGLIRHVPSDLGDQAFQVTVATLSLCLMSDQVVSQAVPFVYLMLERYDTENGLFEVEEEILRIIDITPTPDKLYFLEDLRRLAEADAGKEYASHLLEVLSHAEDFLDLHLTLREHNLSVPDRAWAQLRQCDYLRDTGHRGLHSAACAKLQASLRTTYLAGSGLALARLGHLYEWTDDPVYDGKTRAMIMDEATDILVQAKQYPLALELCAATTAYHQQQTFDYERIAQLLRMQAELYEILPAKSVTSMYHRIRVYGASPILSDYVLVTTSEEELRKFCNRLLSTWPGALIVESAPGPDMISEDTLILVERLDPEPDLERDCIKNARHHEYYLTNDVGQFSITRRSKEGDGVDKETVITANSYPSILPFSPVISTSQTTLSALEYAKVIVKKEVTKVLQINLKPESTRKAARIQLDNAIDLPADTGLLLFRKTFLEPTTSPEEPETAALSSQLISYAKALHDCLQVHTSVCPAELVGYHKNLVKLFKRNFAPEIKADPTLEQGIEVLPPTPKSSAPAKQINGSKEGYATATASPPSIKVIPTAIPPYTSPVKPRSASNATSSLAPTSTRPDSRLSVSSNSSSRGSKRLMSLLRRNKQPSDS